MREREREQEDLQQPLSEQPADSGRTKLPETTLNSTMEDAEKGSQQHPDSVPEVGEDAVVVAGPSTLPPVMTEEERHELQEELVKVEDEILTLSQVLAAKEKQLADIKRKLNITPLNELKQNFTKTWQDVTTSSAYKRTSAAFTNVGTAITRKLEDVRNAPTFRSFEEKVETLKIKMSPSASTSSDSGEPESGIPPSESLLSQPNEDLPTQETPMN